MNEIARRWEPVWLVMLLGIGISSPVVADGKFGSYSPEPRYSDFSSESFYLPLRDGTRIAIRVDRPADDGVPIDGRFPVVWHHTLSITVDREGRRWRGSAPGLGDMWKLTRHGYVVVQVARRGNGQSFGTMRGYHDRNEAQDAYEITEWLAAQPWSDGNVGIYGCSNTGDAAMHAATVRPPALKAVFAGCFSWHKYDPFRRGGIFAQWGTGPMRTIEQDMDQEPVDGDEDKVLLRQAAEEHQRMAPLYDLWAGMPYRNSYSPLVASPFWQEGSSANYADQIRESGVAVYIMGGWFDELRDQGFIAQANIPGSRIVMGPWKHCMNDGFPLFEEIHRFFDHELKGMDAGIAASDPIHYFVMNGDGGRWESAGQWPPAETKDMSLYFSANATLESKPPQDGAQPLAFEVMYEIECPETGDGQLNWGPFAQPCFVEGAGVSFTRAAFDEDTEVTGHPVADVWVSAEAPDANVFAYLEDVAPDGTVTSITEGRLKASVRATHEAPWEMPGDIPWHRAFEEDANSLEPGKPVRLTFDFLPTSWVFRAGHRPQVTITGADPRERARDENGLAKRLSIYADKEHASSVVLPVVER
jgi:putative CocE/NonD family hydrolase